MSVMSIRGAAEQQLTTSPVISWLGVMALTSVVLTDLARRWTVGQSPLISSVPLTIATLGAAVWVLSPGRVPLPRYFALAIASLIAMCCWGSFVGTLKGLPPAQVVAGWLAEAGAAPGLLMGFAVATDEGAWTKFWKATVCIVYFSVAVAFLQQFGMLRIAELEMIENSQTSRSLSTGAQFQYTWGPFRTANVFSGFLAAMGLVGATRFAEQVEQRGPYDRHLRLSNIVFLIALVICSLLAARRSGLFMLLSALIPLLIFLPGRLTKILTIVIAIAAIAFLMGKRQDDISDFRQKIEFATSETDFSGRFAEALSVNDDDWDLLSWTGDGIGSHGPATQAGGALAFELDKYLLDRHPVIHVGWFKSLLGYGPLGALLQFTWFAGLIAGLRALSKQYGVSELGSRYCGFVFLSVVTFNHYFVATSWLQSVSGGLVLGLSVGIFSGRLQLASMQAGFRSQVTDS